MHLNFGEKRENLRKAGVFCIVYMLLLYVILSLIAGAPYLHGFRYVLFAALLNALAGYYWHYDTRYLGITAFMTFFLTSGSWVQLLDHAQLTPYMVLGNMTFAGALWAGLLLFWVFIRQAGNTLGIPLLGKCIGNVLLGAGLLVLSLFNTIFWGYFAISRHYLRPDIVMTVYQTNLKEALDYLSSQPTSHLLLVVPVLVLFGLGFYKILHYVCQTGNPSKRSQKFTKGSLVLLPVSLLLIRPILFMSGQTTAQSFQRYELFRIIIAVRDSVRSYQDFAANKAKRQAQLAQLGTLPVRPGHQGLYVLVIGESNTRDHMGVYGYARATTPFLSQLAQEKKAMIFPHAYSNHTHTVPTLTYALTEKNQYNQVKPEDAYSLTEVDQAAGFSTYWFSNQTRYGAWATPVTEIGSTAQHQVWLNGEIGESSYAAYHDGLLVEKAAKDLSQAENALIVIHLMGEHTKYPDRYPAEFAQFTGSANPQVDQYDNAVLYTDDVLKQIYQLASKNPHFQGLVYFSDHGEEVEQGKSHESTKFTPPMSHIPLILILSPAYQQQNPALYRTLSQQRQNYWTNDLAYNLLVELMGIQNLPLIEPQFTLGSPAYDRDKENLRTLHGERKLE